MELICVTALIFWAIVTFTGCVLALISVVIESKYIYYLKKGVK